MLNQNELKKLGIKVKQKEENPLLSTLKRHYPHILQDGKISLKSLKENLAKALNLQDANELENMQNLGGYELNFTGKGLANALYNSECEKELKLDEIFELNALNCHDFAPSSQGEAEISSTQRVQDFGDKNGALQGEARELPQMVMTAAKPKQSPFLAQKTSPYAFKVNNMIIKGDNLDALKILKSAYSGKIKMIYIDPPYNTQSDNFIYPDNFRDDYKAILREVGLIEINENGQEVESENLKFFKNITASRTHSGWLCFMLPRLKLARDLLKDDGVIFISIDDNEQANLKLLCDEIFGEDNFVSNIIWNSINSVLKQSNFIRKEHEYILCYAKNKDNLIFNKLENTMEFQNIDNDPKGEWFSSNAAFPNQNSNKNKFAITLPNGTQCVRNWKFTYDEFASGKVNLYFKGGNVPRLKIYKSEYNLNTRIESSIFKELGSITTAKSEIGKILGNDDLFDTPKPTKLIKHLLKISSSANQNEQPDIILDFFAGSGTSAQAVMELNAEDGGNREFILVQLEEKIDPTKANSSNKATIEAAYQFCKNELGVENPVISDITIERVKRAAKKIYEKMKINDEKDSKAEVSLGDFVGCEAGSKGVCLSQMTEADSQNSRKSVKETTPNFNFKVFSLKDKAKIIVSDKNSLKIEDKSDLSPFDKALNLILQSGNSLNKNIKTIIENKLYECENAYFVAHLDKEVGDFLQDKTNEIYLNGFEIDDLEGFLNLSSSLKENITVIF